VNEYEQQISESAKGETTILPQTLITNIAAEEGRDIALTHSQMLNSKHEAIHIPYKDSKLLAAVILLIITSLIVYSLTARTSFHPPTIMK
jgi:hypothetical protein